MIDKNELYKKYKQHVKMNDVECEWLTYFESLKSRGDKDHVAKSDPVVAALVRNKEGIVLGLTHRAVSFEGDHAEFSLLKCKLNGTDFTDCELFTTLEPCVDDVRGKVGSSCSSIISSTSIRRVHVGLLDPNIKVYSKGITFLYERGISIFPYCSEVKKKISESLIKFSQNCNRQAEILRFENEVLPLFQKKTLELYLRDVAIKKNVQFDFNHEKIEFINMLLDKNYVSFDAKNVYIYDDVKIMFFDRRHLSDTSRRIKIQNGDDALKKYDNFDDSIPILIHRIKDYYLKDRKLSKIDKTEFREAICNAIIHKEYDKNAPGIRIRINLNSVTISNLASKNIPKSILSRLPSFDIPNDYPGNGILCELCNYSGYAERSLKGCDTFKKSKHHPVISVTDNEVEFIFKEIHG